MYIEYRQTFVTATYVYNVWLLWSNIFSAMLNWQKSEYISGCGTIVKLRRSKTNLEFASIVRGSSQETCINTPPVLRPGIKHLSPTYKSDTSLFERLLSKPTCNLFSHQRSTHISFIQCKKHRLPNFFKALNTCNLSEHLLFELVISEMNGFDKKANS